MMIIGKNYPHARCKGAKKKTMEIARKYQVADLFNKDIHSGLNHLSPCLPVVTASD